MPRNRFFRSFLTPQPAPRSVWAARSAILATAFLVAAMSVGPAAEASQRRSAWAITGATVITSPGNAMDNATVVLRDGLIESVTGGGAAPADARVIDGAGMTVYAGWIDAASDIAILDEPAAAAASGAAARGGRGGAAQLQMLELGAPGVNDRVTPEFVQADRLSNEDTAIGSMRNAGFTAALVVPQEGIYRGQSVLVALSGGDTEQMVLQQSVTQTVGFSSGGFGRGYPSSAMGVVSLIKQVLLDTQRQATWESSYANDPTGLPRPETNPAYTALMPALAGRQHTLFVAGNTREAKRAIGIGREFGLSVIIQGNGNEYEMAQALADGGARVIVPLDYPDRPTIGDDDTNLDVDFDTLRRWESAPGNAAALENAGVTFAFTSDGVDANDFAEHVRKAIDAGLSEDAALAALTTAAAEMFGVDAILGTVEAGKIANVVVATGAPFAEGTEIRHVFVDGMHTEVEAGDSGGGGRRGRGGDDDGPADPLGNWAVTLGNAEFSTEMTWVFSGAAGAYTGTFDGEAFDRVQLRGNTLTVAMTTPMGSMAVDMTVAGDRMNGSFSVEGYNMNISGRRTSGPGFATLDNGERR